MILETILPPPPPIDNPIDRETLELLIVKPSAERALRPVIRMEIFEP